MGLENYVRGIETTQFFASFGWTLLITVGSVVLILVCTSMCAWWIVRVNNWAGEAALHPVPVQYDRAVPDGDVHPLQARRTC